MVFVPRYFVLIGELFVLGDSCEQGDVGGRKQWLFRLVSVKCGVVGDKANFGFLEDKD